MVYNTGDWCSRMNVMRGHGLHDRRTATFTRCTDPSKTGVISHNPRVFILDGKNDLSLNVTLDQLITRYNLILHPRRQRHPQNRHPCRFAQHQPLGSWTSRDQFTHNYVT
ncbi:hypothetical protein [Arthrobacter sp. P2b]|uniref:hypothetical protein n=1 Tax=Arthrobacter sp. P2b TaxID=1938741 RepID=UPI001116560B|nr:hypothetical protein [Arthrobacter sp. P2b]